MNVYYDQPEILVYVCMCRIDCATSLTLQDTMPHNLFMLLLIREKVVILIITFRIAKSIQRKNLKDISHESAILGKGVFGVCKKMFYR